MDLSDPTGQTPDLSLGFSSVTATGVTTVIPVAEGPSPPEGLRLGEETVYYELNTTATFTGPVELCLDYSGMDVGNESELKLYHYVGEAWVDITTSLDMENDIICGEVSSLSIFALMVPRPKPATPAHLAVVKATVMQDGAPAAGLELAFSRSIAGRPANYLWSGATDGDGKVRIEILTDDPQFWRCGSSGYYMARGTSAAGTEISTWCSIPITGGIEVTMTLHVGGDVVIEGERSLEDLGFFGLSDNYPNPFNPSTQIRYEIPEAGEVSLVVYNVLGQEVRRLVQGQQSAGVYRVMWDGKDALGRPVSSGVYLYRLTSGTFSEARRMLLLK